ncbi:MAG: hypothetical protein QXU02_05100 [Candidatus Bathyarchaeia archaeon]
MLAERGIRPPGVMSNIRRLERKGLVYVRSYWGVRAVRRRLRRGYIFP